jgi:hypothetical protein
MLVQIEGAVLHWPVSVYSTDCQNDEDSNNITVASDSGDDSEHYEDV